MKIRAHFLSASALLSSLALPLEAWSPVSLQDRGRLRQSRLISVSSSAPIAAPHSSLRASLMTEGEADLAAPSEELTGSPKQTPLAKGTVVSFFRGGLAAIKVERIDDDAADDDDDDADKGAPRVLSPTMLPEFKKDASADAGGDLVGHKVILPGGQSGVVVAHRPPIAFVYSGVESTEGLEGTVKVLKELTTVSIGTDRKVVGWDGALVNGKEEAKTTSEWPMFAPIPQVKDIALINNPMLTGNTMVDVLAPIGQGQNMLLVSDDLAAARRMICDFISIQKKSGRNTKFVYAAIDDSADALAKLTAAGVVDDVHVVMSRDDDQSADVEEASKAAESTAMAATACAIGESYALQQGMNAVVVVDTLDQHKKMWDATTRVLVDIFGVESVVKSDREGGASSEMRGFFSSIIQRSAQYKEKRGGGSVTLLLLCQLPKLSGADEDTVFQESDFESGSEKVKARIRLLVTKGIPLTAATLRKIDIPVPSASEGQRRLVLQHIDDLISMSDGQIWMDEVLRNAGQYPPVDPQRSITRIGIGADTNSRADAPALRRVAEGLRLALSQAAAMDGAENTIASKKQVRAGKALLLAMHQVEGKGGRTLSESCTALLAATKGWLDEAVDAGKTAGTEEGQIIIDGLLEYVQKVAPSATATIDQSLDLPADTQKEVLNAIESYFTK